MDPASTDHWRAIIHRDKSADGTFFYGVKTTGVYCRPWCPSRRPNPRNLVFFETEILALRAGFRACRRCGPLARPRGASQRDIVIKACEIMESADVSPSLEDLSSLVGASPSHFHRSFKKLLGITPRGYAEAVRARKSRALKHGGKHMVIQYAVATCHLGPILVAGTERGVRMIAFGESAEDLRGQLKTRFPRAELREGDPAFITRVEEVLRLVESPGREFGPPLDIQGTAFQRRVWEALREVPAGTTTTYTEVARKIGQPNAARAVAGACAANALAVAIPCHRVVREDGTLSGYRWGTDKKRALLDLEARDMAAAQSGTS